jgi:hypothetical protein
MPTRVSPRDRVVISMTCGDIFLGLIAILFPPIAGEFPPPSIKPFSFSIPSEFDFL